MFEILTLLSVLLRNVWYGTLASPPLNSRFILIGFESSVSDPNVLSAPIELILLDKLTCCISTL